MPDFPIWPQCNIGCVFCSNPVEGYRETTEQYSYEKLKQKLLEYKAGQPRFLKFDEVRDYFNLTGGEPTLHPEFLKVLALVRSEFPKNLIRLLTNGRLFAYEDFARRVFGVAQAPFEIAVPMFGHDAKTHESISRAPGSFAQTTQGLRHIAAHRRPGQSVEIRIIMTRVQARYLEGLLDYLADEFPWVDRVVFLYQEIEGFAELYRDRLVMPMSEVAALLDAQDARLARFKEARLYHFSLCAVPTRQWPRVWNTLAGLKIDHAPACGACVYRDQCVGVHKSYLRHAGAPDIKTIRRKRRDASETGDRYHPFRTQGAPARA